MHTISFSFNSFEEFIQAFRPLFYMAPGFVGEHSVAARDEPKKKVGRPRKDKPDIDPLEGCILRAQALISKGVVFRLKDVGINAGAWPTRQRFIDWAKLQDNIEVSKGPKANDPWEFTPFYYENGKKHLADPAKRRVPIPIKGAPFKVERKRRAVGDDE